MPRRREALDRAALLVAALTSLGHSCTVAVPLAPPTSSRVELRRWLAEGWYRSWRCEPAPHDPREPSAHVRNRVCSNALIAAEPEGPGAEPYPVGAASVKELFDAQDRLIGHAVSVRTSRAPGAASWFWAQYLPAGTTAPTPTPVELDGTVAEGFGGSGGNAGTLCAPCHGAAPRDFVFTPVR